MNKKLIVCALAVFTAGSMLPGIAGAVDTTTSSSDTTTAATVDPNAVPTACVEPIDIVGPARAAHSPSARPSGEEDVVLPSCDDVEGICVELVIPAPGPARAAHRPEESVDTTEVPCVPIDPSCDIVVNLDTSGPARAAHQPALGPILIKGYLVEIPEACQEALSLAALPDSGSDSATIMWLGAALVLIGGALVLTRRTALVRTR